MPADRWRETPCRWAATRREWLVAALGRVSQECGGGGHRLHRSIAVTEDWNWKGEGGRQPRFNRLPDVSKPRTGTEHSPARNARELRRATRRAKHARTKCDARCTMHDARPMHDASARPAAGRRSSPSRVGSDRLNIGFIPGGTRSPSQQSQTRRLRAGAGMWFV